MLGNCSSVTATRSSTRPTAPSGSIPASSLRIRSTWVPRASSGPELAVAGALLVHRAPASTRTPRTRAVRRARRANPRPGRCRPVAPRLVSGMRGGPPSARPGPRRARASALEHDRREVEQDTLEERRQLFAGATCWASNHRLDAATLELLRHRVGPLERAQPHVPGAHPARTRCHRDDAVACLASRAAGPRRRRTSCASGRTRPRRPGRRHRSACFAQHLCRRVLPVGPGTGVLGRGETERALLGLQPPGLVEPAGHRVGHVLEVRSAPARTATRCEVFDPRPPETLGLVCPQILVRGCRADPTLARFRSWISGDARSAAPLFWCRRWFS